VEKKQTEISRIGLAVENQEPATPEKMELIARLIEMTARARNDELLGVAMVEVHADGSYLPIISGDIGSLAEVHMQMSILNRTLEDAVSGSDDDE
jgi:hypothetical protein